MRYYVLLFLVITAAYAVANAATSLAVRLAWPLTRAWVSRRRPSRRAQTLAMLRVAPVAAATAWSVTVGAVFLRFEPRNTTEFPGMILMAAAACALMLIATAALELAHSLSADAHCTALVRQCGRPWVRPDGLPIWIVDTAYPVAAVAGIFRPRLLLSARLIAECPEGEMDAIIRHEAAHLRRRDNLLRAAMRCLPDMLSLTRTATEIHTTWAAAVEQVADDEAAGVEPESRTRLAAALVRVARMTDGPPPAWMPGVVAFYEGEHLEERVRRLLAPCANVGTRPVGFVASFALVGLVSAMATNATTSLQLHLLMEAAVRLLP